MLELAFKDVNGYAQKIYISIDLEHNCIYICMHASLPVLHQLVLQLVL